MSREIYGFIHRERASPVSPLRALVHLGSSGDPFLRRTYVPKKRISHSRIRLRVRMSSRMCALDVELPPRVPANPHSVISREICLRPSVYPPRNPPFNRDLPECLRKEAAVSRHGRGRSRFPVCRLARKRRVNLIAATYRGCGSK